MQNAFDKIGRVSIELSNLCNYAPLHKKCPLHAVKAPVILPQRIVFKVLDFLSEKGFSGKIGFHTYNEPGIDPRLFLFIKYARERCPQSYIFFMTNGYYLDENLVEEYRQIGLDEIMISAYTDADYRRFLAYKAKIKMTVNRPRLDERLDLYIRPEINLNKPCYAPLNELIITREGYVGLCCLDWKREVVFGDLYSDTLENILKSDKLLQTYENLSSGNRRHTICKRCDWSR